MSSIQNPIPYVTRIVDTLQSYQDDSTMKRGYAARKASLQFCDLIAEADSDKECRDTLYMREKSLMNGAERMADLLGDVPTHEVQRGVRNFYDTLPNLKNKRLDALVQRAVSAFQEQYNQRNQKFSI